MEVEDRWKIVPQSEVVKLGISYEVEELKQHNQDLEEQAKAILQLKEVEFSRLKEMEFRETEATLPGSWKN